MSRVDGVKYFRTGRNVRHELPRLRRDAQRRAPRAPQLVDESVAVLLLREVHVQALAARQARRAEGQSRFPDGADRVLERPHRPRAGAAVRSYLNPCAEISSTFAHFACATIKFRAPHAIDATLST